jgi:ribosomal protein S18 acetylase RimI-like enzyme
VIAVAATAGYFTGAMSLLIRPTIESDRPYIRDTFLKWGDEFVVTRGRKVYFGDVEGFCAFDNSDDRLGLVTYQISTDQCEIITLDTSMKRFGIGTALIEAVKARARLSGCRRLWLITTNDNVSALRFYQLIGFHVVAVHTNAIAESRRLKPSIPMTGRHGIPIRDELEFEMTLPGT